MAVRTLAFVAKSPKAPVSARVMAAEALLSRGWGKPMQPVSADGDLSVQITIRNIVEEVKVIDVTPREVTDDKSK